MYSQCNLARALCSAPRRRYGAMALGEGKLEVVLGQKSCSKPKDGRLQSSKRLRLATLARRANAVVARAARCLLVLPPPPLVPLVQPRQCRRRHARAWLCPVRTSALLWRLVVSVCRRLPTAVRGTAVVALGTLWASSVKVYRNFP